MKKGVSLEEDSLRHHQVPHKHVDNEKCKFGFYVLELSQFKKTFFIVAYAVETVGLKYVKKISMKKGI